MIGVAAVEGEPKAAVEGCLHALHPQENEIK